MHISLKAKNLRNSKGLYYMYLMKNFVEGWNKKEKFNSDVEVDFETAYKNIIRNNFKRYIKSSTASLISFSFAYPSVYKTFFFFY